MLARLSEPIASIDPRFFRAALRCIGWSWRGIDEAELHVRWGVLTPFGRWLGQRRERKACVIGAVGLFVLFTSHYSRGIFALGLGLCIVSALTYAGGHREAP